MTEPHKGGLRCVDNEVCIMTLTTTSTKVFVWFFSCIKLCKGQGLVSPKDHKAKYKDDS